MWLQFKRRCYRCRKIFRFIEILIDDVVAANQYYNKKFESIKQEYEKLNTLVQADFKKVDRIVLCNIAETRFISQSEMGLYALIKD